jgi:hypothetical protein
MITLNDVPGLELFSIGVVRIGEILILFFCIIIFTHFEVKSHGFITSLKNRFVLITVVTGISTLVCQASSVLYFFSSTELLGTFLTATEQSAILTLSNSFLFVSTSSHISLLYLRTEAVLISSPKILVTMKVLTSIYFIGAIGTFVLAIPLSLFSPDSKAYSYSFLVFEAISVASAFSMAAIDIVSAVSFWRFVQHINAALQDSQTVLVVNKKSRQTNLIARRGIWISLMSTSGICFFVVHQIGIITDTIIQNLLWLITTTTIVIVAILWMELKIRLELLAKQKVDDSVYENSKSKKPETVPTEAPSRIALESFREDSKLGPHRAGSNSSISNYHRVDSNLRLN